MFIFILFYSIRSKRFSAPLYAFLPGGLLTRGHFQRLCIRSVYFLGINVSNLYFQVQGNFASSVLVCVMHIYGNFFIYPSVISFFTRFVFPRVSPYNLLRGFFTYKMSHYSLFHPRATCFVCFILNATLVWLRLAQFFPIPFPQPVPDAMEDRLKKTSRP